MAQVVASVHYVQPEGFVKMSSSFAVVLLSLQRYPTQGADGVGVFLQQKHMQQAGLKGWMHLGRYVSLELFSCGINALCPKGCMHLCM